jgi:hypothetical protein
MSKRPWKKFARILRVEFNSGDVKFLTQAVTKLPEPGVGASLLPRGEFESLDAAEADLDQWWVGFWPAQIKSRRPA